MKKRGLLIGINDYKNIRDLKGCHNDVLNVRNVLKEIYEFSNHDIRVVLDDRATADEIKERMDWLTHGLESGDRIVLHFSGHGSQIRDRNHDELKDHKDEILCCYGMNWNSGFISDDYFDWWMSLIPYGVVGEVILDACHSGGESAGWTKMPDVGPGGILLSRENPNVTERFLKPPLDIELRSDGEILETKRVAVSSFNKYSMIEADGVNDGLLPSKINVWSGCGEAQTSADAFIDTSFNGAFTYYWCGHLRKNKGIISRKTLLKDVRESLKKYGYTQQPELAGNDVYAFQSVLS